MKHRCVCAAGASLLLAFSVTAQSPQYAVATAGVDSVPQTTVVPVQQPPVQLTEHTTVYEASSHAEDRAERRALRAKVYAAKIDSLVESRDYLFFPNSMQQQPRGLIRSVYANYFFFGLFVTEVKVHLPTERGITQYVDMLNFDSTSIADYQAARTPWGWNISFDIFVQKTLYHADLIVSTSTGETVLTLITPTVAMRYVGWLWDRRVNDPKFSRLN